MARAGLKASSSNFQGFGALAYSLEVPRRQNCVRYLSDICYIPRAPIEYGRIARGDYDDEEAARPEAARKTLSRLPLTLDASSKLTMAEIGAGFAPKRPSWRKAGRGWPWCSLII